MSMANETGTERAVGKVVQVIGPVLDVEFEGHLPAIYNALHIKVSASGSGSGIDIDVIAEVEQHLGENRVRAVAMQPTDGMQRGMAAGSDLSVNFGELSDEERKRLRALLYNQLAIPAPYGGLL